MAQSLGIVVTRDGRHGRYAIVGDAIRPSAVARDYPDLPILRESDIAALVTYQAGADEATRVALAQAVLVVKRAIPDAEVKEKGWVPVRQAEWKPTPRRRFSRPRS